MTVLLVTLMALACATAAHADVAVGQRVRATLIARPDAPIVAAVLALPPDTLWLAVEPDSAARAFARADIARLERSTGMHNNAGKGALIGAAVGGLGGALLGALFAGAIKEGDAGAIPIVIGLGGAVGGALIGAAIGEGSRHEGWEPVGP